MLFLLYLCTLFVVKKYQNHNKGITLMKKFFLFFAAALFCANVNADQAVTVNPSGNAKQGHFPVYGNNADEKGQKVQAIYLADQLKAVAEGREIKALTFYSDKSNQDWGKAEFKVSLAKTDDTNFPNTTGGWATASEGSTLTKVYEGPLSVVDGELVVNFTTPYAYEGGNLLMQVEITTASDSYAKSSFYSATTANYLIKYANSGSSREANQPKVTLVLAGGGDDPVSQDCKAPTAITVETFTDVTATVSWEGEASQYQYCLEFEGKLPDWTNAKLTDQKSVTLSGLYEEEKYYLYVRSYCSATEVSEAVKATFKTACTRLNVPWIETFTRDASGGETAGDVAPECWFISSANPAVTVTSEKEDDGQGNQIATGQQYLNARGGATSVQVFALPFVGAPLNTLEVAFDYKTSLTTEGCGLLEVGYMTNPNKAETFVSLQTLPRTLEYQHVVVALNELPANAAYIAFRFAGGTSDLCNVSMDNFVVAEIGKSGEVDPSQEIIPDASIYALSYCQAQFMWYSYNASAFAIGLFNADSQSLVAGVTVTTEECDRFAYEDQATGEFSGFPTGDDYNNHYYCSTKWILNVDESGMQRGDAWASSVRNTGSDISPLLGLNPGKYQIQIYELVESTETASGYDKGALLATIPFEIVAKYVTDLQAVVAEDHQTATLTWVAPEFESGERLYVRVWAGETVAYDNYETKDRPESPLTVNVVEGKSYAAIVQVIDRNQNPLGPEVSTNFTVGVNQYEPKNPHAEVAGGDNVTFTWEADAAADRYVITLYWNGEFHATLTVSGTSKMTTMPKDGTWSWTIQAFNQGANGNYFEVSNAIAGNDFETKAAEIPDDAIKADVWAIEAAYMDENSGYDAGGKNAWYISLATGEEDGNGLPSPIFMIYSDKQNAISGIYNTTRGNIDLANCGMDITGKLEDADDAVEAELRLLFDGYDDEKAESGYYYGYYTGEYRMVTKSGKTYVGNIFEVFCNSFTFSSYGAAYREYVGMWEEDPNYDPFQGIEEVVATTPNGKKVLYNNQLLIIRDGKAYNVLGTLVK